MPTLLFEIGCEELPGGFCRRAEEELRAHWLPRFGGRGRALVGPRRIAVLVEEFDPAAGREEKRGPAEAVAFEGGRPTRAAEGFARGAGVAVEELSVHDGYVWARTPPPPLSERLWAMTRGLAGGKTMVWDRDVDVRFPRPIRWLCAKLDGEGVDVGPAEIPAGGVSYGHRFQHGDVWIDGAGAYEETLRSAGVIADAEERRRRIVAGLDALGDWTDPACVLDEVVYLVEWPLVLGGTFDERFLRLPERVLVTAMQSHQRYFPLGGSRFAFVANGGDPDVVRTGNERVLAGRLDDAAFTFDRDVAVGIDGLADRLDTITFFAGAGTFAEKVRRLVALVERLGGGAASAEAARLAKADQASELVREFPELEGFIGAEYARLAGYPEAVCAAIEEQYLPDSATGPLPATEAGKVLAAADRLDTLTVSFALGHKPTGSRDPYGLRRAAIGLCRLALEGGLRIERGLMPQDVREFVEERLESLLDLAVEFVRAAVRSRVSDLGGVAELARFLAALDDARLEPAHTTYTRSVRIVGNAEPGEVDPDLLLEAAERELAAALDGDSIAAAVEERRFDDALASASSLAPLVDRFFDDVLVMTEDRSVRANRLRLLLAVRDAVGALGDLAQIPR
ncbi:MAG: glycine--tRNA ligase subunit beta [Actinomycetota bacterium]|nr:glycine--tRNA ligase subunit beta [Actinomycetota bacterium]